MAGALKLNSTGGGSVAFDPGSTASNLTFTFPASSGQLAVSDGSSSFSALTVTGNTYLATSSGNVGIGTSSPSQKVVASNNGADNIFMCENTSTSPTTQMFMQASNSGGTVGTLSNHFLKLLANNTEQVRVTTGGTVILAGGSTSATGVGITFPATQSASSDANTLDDYEEGTFTPAWIAGTWTYGNRAGKYTKIGNTVVLSGAIIWSAKSGSGNMGITLPFPTSSTSGDRFVGPTGYQAGLSNWASATQTMWLASGGSSGTLYFYGIGNGINPVNYDVGNMSASGEVQFSITYQTA